MRFSKNAVTDVMVRDGTSLYTLLFADDQIPSERREERNELSRRHVSKKLEKYELRINKQLDEPEEINEGDDPMNCKKLKR